MKFPSLKEEHLLWKTGHPLVAGLDEVGRGPLAGPVVAACVCIQNPKFKRIPGVRNSKALSPAAREKIFRQLTASEDISFGVGIVSEKVIDKVNILQATKLAMTQALQQIQADFLLIDGNFSIDSPIAQRSIIKGDEKVYSIAAASVIAKVTRDRLMQEYHTQYPEYGFDSHKGYGSPQHLAALAQHGPCDLHRKTFYPIKQM